MRYTKFVDNLFPKEMLDPSFSDGRDSFHLYPLGEMVNGHNQELFFRPLRLEMDLRYLFPKQQKATNFQLVAMCWKTCEIGKQTVGI